MAEQERPTEAYWTWLKAAKPEDRLPYTEWKEQQ